MSVHSDAAQARVEDVRALRQKFPNLVIPTSKSESQRLSKAASVPEPFVELTAVAIKNSPALVRGGANDPEQTRDLMSYAEAYAPVADELEALAKFVRHSVTVARNKAGSDALTTYALAQRLVKRPENADLAPHVDAMRTALKAKRRKVKEQPPPVA